MDFRKFSLVFLFCLVMFTNCTGLTVQMTSSASKVERGQSVTVNIRVENIKKTDNSLSFNIYLKRNLKYRSTVVKFNQYSSSCSVYTSFHDDPVNINAYCGSGTNEKMSRFREYRVVMTTAAMAHLTAFYCRIEHNSRYYYSNTVTVAITHKVDCCVLCVSEGGDLLTVVEGRRYDGFTCKVGGASPEPETKLKMNETDLRVTTQKSVTSSETGLTLCSPLKQEIYSPKTEISFTYIPERSDHNKEIYCSARNSEMRTDEEVKSNRIRLVVYYGPVDEETSLKPDKTTHTLTEFGSLRVSCVADCRPGCKYTWSLLDRVIATEDTLSLSNVTQQQSGYYKCTARNPETGAKVEKFFRINVFRKLSVWAAVGVGVSCGVVVIGLAVVVVICIRRKRKGSEKVTSVNSAEEIYVNASFENRKNVNPEDQYEDLRQQ